MKLRKTMALIISKLLIRLLRIIGKGGTSLPGKVALLIYPNILKDISLNIETIIITGTNGKTTTSRIISKMLSLSSMDFFENKSGANLISGIATTFISNFNSNAKYAVIECDEAAFKKVSLNLNIKYVLVTNLFRDQLDRFGEITHTLNNIIIGIKNCEQAIVVLNADCSLTSSISKQVNNKVVFYGIDLEINKNITNLSDAPYCIFCKSKYSYKYHTYGHLGGFYCENCGYKRPTTHVSVVNIEQFLSRNSTVLLKLNGNTYSTKINLPGEYNIYNAISAVAIGYALELKDTLIINALASFEGGFGRMEHLSLNDINTFMVLVKNPAGLNSVINYLNSIKKQYILTLVLNDNFADGTDVSWIWDVNFENLNLEYINSIFVSGTRFDDMALRLKYAGIDEKQIIKFKSYDHLIKEITNNKYSNYNSYILPTYTAMFELRKKLTKIFNLKDFWK